MVGESTKSVWFYCQHQHFSHIQRHKQVLHTIFSVNQWYPCCPSNTGIETFLNYDGDWFYQKWSEEALLQQVLPSTCCLHDLLMLRNICDVCCCLAIFFFKMMMVMTLHRYVLEKRIFSPTFHQIYKLFKAFFKFMTWHYFYFFRVRAEPPTTFDQQRCPSVSVCRGEEGGCRRR